MIVPFDSNITLLKLEENQSEVRTKNKLNHSTKRNAIVHKGYNFTQRGTTDRECRCGCPHLMSFFCVVRGQFVLRS